jgi:hypothetical protein
MISQAVAVLGGYAFVLARTRRGVVKRGDRHRSPARVTADDEHLNEPIDYLILN